MMRETGCSATFLQPLYWVLDGAPAFSNAAKASRDLHLAAHTTKGMPWRSCKKITVADIYAMSVIVGVSSSSSSSISSPTPTKPPLKA
jgi:hypothetical protein